MTHCHSTLVGTLVHTAAAVALLRTRRSAVVLACDSGALLHPRRTSISHLIVIHDRQFDIKLSATGVTTYPMHWV